MEANNATKLREVLEWAVTTIDVSDEVLEETEDWENEVVSWVRELQDKAKAALATPPRNCDVPYPDTVAMYDAFKKWCNNKGHTMEPKLASDAFAWMLAAAPPQEGAKS